MNESILPPSPDSSAVIERDLLCIRCEYNLRTLALYARCPECGTPVEDSLIDEEELDRRYRLRRWMALLGAAVVIGIVSMSLNNLYWFNSMIGGTVGDYPRYLDWLDFFWALLMVPAAWLLTGRKLQKPYAYEYSVLVWTVRLIALLWLLDMSLFVLPLFHAILFSPWYETIFLSPGYVLILYIFLPLFVFHLRTILPREFAASRAWFRRWMLLECAMGAGYATLFISDQHTTLLARGPAGMASLADWLYLVLGLAFMVTSGVGIYAIYLTRSAIGPDRRTSPAGEAM